MNALRWILGALIVLAGGGFIALDLLGGSFRKSFGASDVNPLITLLPLVGMGLLLYLAAWFWFYWHAAFRSAP